MGYGPPQDSPTLQRPMRHAAHPGLFLPEWPMFRRGVVVWLIPGGYDGSATDETKEN
jgi:hypothetical protein